MAVIFTKLPPCFNTMASPWRVSDNVENSETINRILGQSIIIQSSSIPKSEHFNLRRNIVSNGCIQIGFLMRYYLSCLDIEAKVHCGTMKRVDKGRYRTRNNMMHIFLEIENEIIDNAYIFNHQVHFNILKKVRVKLRSRHLKPKSVNSQITQFFTGLKL